MKDMDMPFLAFIGMMQLLVVVTAIIDAWMGSPLQYKELMAGIFIGYLAVLVSYVIWLIFIKPWVGRK